MFTNKLAKLLEKQRKRQIAALLAVCTPEERERINAARQTGRETRRRLENEQTQ